MSSVPIAKAGPRLDAPAPTTTPTGPHPVWAGVASGLLLWASFPPADWGWLAWVALVPLFTLVVSARRPRSVYVGAWVGGLVFWVPAIQWLRLTDATAWVGWLTMALALSAFWPAFLFLARWSNRRLGLPLMIAAPVAWVALEYVRAYAVTGFPWYYLAHSQHSVLPLIQVADVTGSLGVSLALAVANAWLVDVLSLPLLRPTPAGPRLTRGQTVRFGAVVGMIAAMLGYGAFRLATAEFRPGPRIALLQSNLPQRLKMGSDPNKALQHYKALVERALRAAAPPDLIVWPETSYPFSYIAISPEIAAAELERQVEMVSTGFTGATWRERASLLARPLRDWADASGAPMVVGAIAHDHQPDGYKRYNAAILVRPGGEKDLAYFKTHLVPFGEYVPLVSTLPWLAALTPFDPDNLPSLAFGAGPVWFDVGPFRFATAICFEDTVPQVVRRSFVEAPDGRRPDVLLNLSNDGWFVDQRADGSIRPSSEHETHLAVSVFRAVEHRAPLARSANTGVSAIVDGNGQVIQSLATLKEGVVSGVVPLDGRRTLYTAWGDWLGQACLAVTIGLFPVGWSRRFSRRSK